MNNILIDCPLFIIFEILDYIHINKMIQINVLLKAILIIIFLNNIQVEASKINL